ncbi:LysR family transcriptional regulator [Helicobacter valdiviensis]|uniref:LysR family transcriptional regulator n=1 Tax=Helicobacter valdiviensis TaxID=1458358 RepID=A0A2W6MTZ0_9HELI|nr:LysR substrate-binding domain-containing protein [Helicobacter valdiviensis]PZT47974.1 LysR family transcriptional regulator [Helicobacter valdiviensis]
MKIRDLEIFLDLLKTKSPTITAQNFKITQPNVSVIIKNIENMIGTPLFERLGKKLMPTPKALFLGGMWLEVVQNYYKSLEVLLEDDLCLGELKVASTHTIGEYFLPKILFDFAKKYPKVKINAQIYNTQECLKLLKMGNVDLAIIEGEISKEQAKSEGFKREVLCKDELVVATSDFILASREHYIDALLDKAWIFREYGSGLRERFLRELGNIGREIPIFLELDRISAIKDLVISRGALAVFSKMAIKKELEEGILFPLQIINLDLEREFLILERESQIPNGALERFREFLESWI